jgi:ABC-type transport system involved in Fe-S cluster assembly fused permease/ATPase subunit
MRHHAGRPAAASSPGPAVNLPAGAPARGDWQTVARLLPYLWAWRGRVLFALACLVAAKLANVGVPLILKAVVDALDQPDAAARAAIAIPVALIVGYGLLRVSVSLFTELRELVFSRVTHEANRTIVRQVFGHLFEMSLRFHLDRQMGGMTRDIERGSQGVSSLISYTLYSILPTLIEVSLVIGYLFWNYDASFGFIALTALVVYVIYTIKITEWRTHFRREMNEQDSRASTRAIDALVNYETVKYFGNEQFESARYDTELRKKMRAAIRSQASLSLLNFGQAAIIAVAVSALMWRAVSGVMAGEMTLGDLVLVNAFMIQLYIPLNFLGVLYREIKQALTDMERMFRLLSEKREIADAPDAKPLVLARGRAAQAGQSEHPQGEAAASVRASASKGPEIRFNSVSFHYDPARPILRDISFAVAPGTTTAVVGASGAGKSTLARLLFRFYEVTDGQIAIDGQDIRAVTQSSLRAAIGIVPQDTVLFNDTIRYNIAYGRPDADDAAIEVVTRAAQLHDFIAALPQGYTSPVGERGLKLSGGEKQRVAIARTLLKDPPILVLDEATSALDTRNEQAIQQALRTAAAGRTALVIAHRLSTIVEADQILVLEAGQIIERGRHEQLLAAGGAYARMWAAQAQRSDEAGGVSNV